jgi:hypothetical protein
MQSEIKQDHGDQEIAYELADANGNLSPQRMERRSSRENLAPRYSYRIRGYYLKLLISRSKHAGQMIRGHS